MTDQVLDAELTGLLRAATERDGVGPLSEQAILTFRRGDARYFVRRDGGALAGYATFDPEAGSGELVVHPDFRRRGHGRALLRELLAAAAEPLRVWAHGDLPAAAALAAAEGLTRDRGLLQLDRPLDGTLPAVPPLPDGVALRTFRPGEDEQAWLAVNARAFAHHPEQGGWTRTDVREREAEGWFDPAGFFLAVREAGGELLGFHWTKVHDGTLGEVYVVGVDPAAQGLGLGRILTVKGLAYLAGLGLDRVMLYVDESNTSAVRLYQSLGFRQFAVDVMYGESGS